MGMDVQVGGGKKKGRAAPEMNVTPLVDVVLVLLIIFMVVTPLMHAHFWIHVPAKSEEVDEPPAQPDPSDAPIVVTVQATGELRINRDVIPDAEFPLRLRRALAAKGERKIFFDAEDGARFARTVEALDLARGAGAAHIAVVTEALH